MAHDLPAGIRHWLAGQVEGLRLSTLKVQHGAISRHYRAGGASSGVVGTGDAVLAYALGRMPATYAACHAALSRLAEAGLDPAPRSILDLGCGTGSATLAALDTFPDIEAISLIDHNAPFLRFAETLLAENGIAAGREMTATVANITGAAGAAADLVTMSYALVELDESVARRAVLKAWERTEKILLLVEPGSRAGFARVGAARMALIHAGAHIAAPCTHSAACPISGEDWCHFSVRLARSRGHRFIKGADVPYEDEKFSYLVAVRAPLVHAAADARIIAPPRHEKGGSRFRLCRAAGLTQENVAARDPAHKSLKKREWGDLFPASDIKPAN